MKPWEHHPALTEDRLKEVARLIQTGRNNALDRYNPVVGSTPWTVGCEAFAFQMHEIIEASAELDWLDIVDASMQFVFNVGGVPCRFYRGDAEDPNTRTLKQSYAELNEQSLFGPEELIALARTPLYRFAVETDVEGSITAISFVVLDGSSPVLIWQIPLDEPVTKITPLWVEGDEGVELPAPVVELAATKKAKKGGTSE